MIKKITLILLSLLSLPSLYAKDTPDSAIYLLSLRGPIGPAASEYIKRGIKIAERERASCLVLKLDTHGGLDEAMREIVQAILLSSVPFITFVYPPGARAASAGTFILMASHIAVMAKGTSCGACHPVAIAGKEISEEMKIKIENDAVSFLKSLALKRKRDTIFAEEAVRKSATLTDQEAKARGVIDFQANSDSELINKIDGFATEINDQEIIITTRNKSIRYLNMNAREKLFQHLTNPNLAYILLMIGMYGIIFELQSPGSLFPGVIGVISLILALYSFQIIPVNYAGLFLIGLSFLLFLLEIKITSYGLLTIGGVTSFVLGSLLLFPTQSPFFPFSPATIIIVSLLTIIFFLLIVGLGIKAHLKKPTTGKEGMLNLIGEVISATPPSQGTVFVRGEYWQAVSLSGPLKKGDKVKVVEIDGMILKVAKYLPDEKKLEGD